MPTGLIVLLAVMVTGAVAFFIARLFTRHLAVEIDEYTVLQALDRYQGRTLDEIINVMHRIQGKKAGKLEGFFWPVSYKTYYLLADLTRRNFVDIYNVSDPRAPKFQTTVHKYQLTTAGYARLQHRQDAYMQMKEPDRLPPSNRQLLVLALMLILQVVCMGFVFRALPNQEAGSAFFIALPFTFFLVMVIRNAQLWFGR